MLHLNALYDLENQIYTDALIQKAHNKNEQKALVEMVDRSAILQAILLADRGYESYNNIAHLQEKGWKYLFRIKDGTNGIRSGLDLPNTDEFDLPVDLFLTRKQTNAAKQLFHQRNKYKKIPAGNVFDYLPSRCEKSQPMLTYNLRFRVVRFRLSDSSFETVVTDPLMAMI